MSRQVPTIFLILLALGCSPAAKDPSPAGPEAAPTEAAPTEAAPTEPAAPVEGALTRVEPSLVCMINNQFMGKAQIPVDVEGTTYYGCCEMCKAKLANDPASRSAVDPISGRTVDKAHAVIGKTASGTVHYFENEQNLAAYVEPKS